MLRSAVTGAVRTVRRAGPRALLLAVLLAGVEVAPTLVSVLLLPLTVLLSLGLVRLLGAWRDDGVPPPPQVDDTGRRVAPTSVTPPVGEPDRRVRGVLAALPRLAPPAVRLAAVSVLLALGVVTITLGLAGGISESPTAEEIRRVQLPFALLLTVTQTFIALAPQRIALEGDPRVVLALAHSVRVARAHFPALLAVESTLLLAALPTLLFEVGLAGRLVQLVAGTLLLPLVVAAETEIYLRGPRLDVPAEFGRRAA